MTLSSTPNKMQGWPSHPLTVFGLQAEDTVLTTGMHHQDCRITMHYDTDRRTWQATLWTPCPGCAYVLVLTTYVTESIPFRDARNAADTDKCHDCVRVGVGELAALTFQINKQEELRNLYEEVLSPRPNNACTIGDIVVSRHLIRLTHPEFQLVDEATRSGDIIIPGWLQGTDPRAVDTRSHIAQRLAAATESRVDVIFHCGLYGFRTTDLTIHLVTEAELIRMEADAKHLSDHLQRMEAVKAHR